MPSRMTWTIGWAAYTLWIMKECKRTRELEVGFQPIFSHAAYHRKEQVLKALEVASKVDAELDNVNKEDPSQEDIAKFCLTVPSHGFALWEFVRKSPQWKGVEEEARAEARKKMLHEHPDYDLLSKTYASGREKGLFNLKGPWNKAGYDDGLNGGYNGLVRRGHHTHTIHDDGGHGHH
eukprot:RCo031425